MRDRTAQAHESDAVARHLGGDPHALDALVAHYRPRLHVFLSRKVGDRHHAEDLTQEVLVRALRNLRKFDRKKSFSVWLFTIAGNAARDFHRNHFRLERVIRSENQLRLRYDAKGNRIPGLEAKDLKYGPLLALENLEARRWFDNAIAGLPPRRREAFVLRHEDGLKFKEIGEHFGATENAVKKMVEKARVQLAEALAPLLE